MSFRTRAMENYNHARTNGLNRDCLDDTKRLKSPFNNNRCPNSVFTPKPVSAGGGSKLAMFAGIAVGVGAAAAPMVAMAVASGGGPQAAGGVSAKSAISTLDNADDSGNADVIKKALEQARPALNSYDEQIKAAETTISGSKEEIATIQGKVDNQKSSVTSLKGEIKDLKGKVDGDKSSQKLTGKQSQLKGQLAKIKEDPKDPNAAKAQREEIQKQIDELENQIKTAKEIEQQIKDKETQLPKEEEKLKDFEQQLEIAKDKAEKAKEQLEKLKPERDQLKAKIERLERKLQNIEATKSADGATAPAADDATAGSGDTIDKTLKGVPPSSNGTTPNSSGSDILSDLKANGEAKPDDGSLSAYNEFKTKIDDPKDTEQGYGGRTAVRGDLLKYIQEHPNATHIKDLEKLLEDL